MTAAAPACWCGNADLAAFSADYLRCPRCETLVRARRPDGHAARVADDTAEFYGREYWFSHQERDLGCPDIRARTRADLPERCVHWLRALLRYRRPPARVLDVGSGPGAFVALLRWAGFDATGLELSPWVVQYVRETFDVPVLCGPIEDQALAPASLDVVVMMDVLEHLADPAGTLRRCLDALRPDGLLLLQTPRYREGRPHEEMVAADDRFLEMLKPPDHLHLFSRRALGELLGRLGAAHVAFEPAAFAEYDMFAVASRAPLPAPAGEAPLPGERPSARLVQALLDLDGARRELAQRYADAEADRAARIAALEDQGRRLGEAEGERNALRFEVRRLEADGAARLAVIEAQGRRLAEAEADRAARLDAIEAQGRRLGEVEGERNALQARLHALEESVAAVEADRAARLAVIGDQGRRLGELEGERNALEATIAAIDADRAARLDVIQAQAARLAALEHEAAARDAEVRELRAVVDSIRRTRVYRFLRRLGRWPELDRTTAAVLRDATGGNGVRLEQRPAEHPARRE